SGLLDAASLGAVSVNTGAQCPPDSRNNHSWITASLLDALSSTPAPAAVDECLSRQDQSAWFKIPIQPGSKVTVSLTHLPANYDLTLYKDIAAAYQVASTPTQRGLTGSARAGIKPVPAAYGSAQTRSLIGVSAQDGTASESIVRNTWDTTTNVYVRVRGRNGVFSLAQPFHLAVTVLTGGCATVSSVATLTAGTTPTLISGTSGSFNTIILWDSSRASRLAGWSAGDLSALT